MKDYKEQIIDVLASSNINIKNIAYQDNFIEKCGISSLDFIKMIFNLEKAFAIKLIDGNFNVDKVNTINNLNDYINARLL